MLKAGSLLWRGLDNFVKLSNNLRLAKARGGSHQKISHKQHGKIAARNCQTIRLTSVQKAFEVQETAQQKKLDTEQSFP